jgi:hypothetical protein
VIPLWDEVEGLRREKGPMAGMWQRLTRLDHPAFEDGEPDD